jgi:hypothetical protein
VDAGSPGRLPRCANFTRVFRPRLLGVATALAFVSLPASMAEANIYTQVLQVYETNATVPPCQFSSKQLESALKGVNTYGQQYFADFTAAVQTALDQRASGACAPAKRGATPAAQSPVPPLRPRPVTAATGASLPAPMVLMAAFAAVLALLGAFAAVWWWRGWDPPWAARWRHAWGEAGHRSRSAATDFDDWLRSG